MANFFDKIFGNGKTETVETTQPTKTAQPTETVETPEIPKTLTAPLPPQKPGVMEIFNLIILDESGSMSCVHKQTIDGCNETINTIRAAQEKYAETQQHYVSIFAFQSGGKRPSRYLIKNIPASEAQHITVEDYVPNGMTPLYDAVGSTLVDLKSIAKTRKDVVGSITIITDGCENSSRNYTQEKVAKMIDGLKELGWNFNFIGANIDVQQESTGLHIDNAFEFAQNDEGMVDMFEATKRARKRLFAKYHADQEKCCPMEEKIASRKQASNRFFEE